MTMKMERNRKWREKSWLWGKSWYNTLDRHWLRVSHAESNECCMLELLGAWKPLYSESSPKAFLEEDPTLVFLMETKFVVSEMTCIKCKLDRQQGLVVLSVRRGKGLALLWKSSMKVDVQTYSP